jgi:hypothetical protein
MASQMACRFPYKINADCPVDSICITCYAATASERNETELIAHDQSHGCDPASFYHAGQAKPALIDHLLEESVVLRQFMLLLGFDTPAP